MERRKKENKIDCTGNGRDADAIRAEGKREARGDSYVEQGPPPVLLACHGKRGVERK
jgi:hypothetical protein